jgi:hypothetical protein
MAERILIVVNPVGDAILSEPLVAPLREPLERHCRRARAPVVCARLCADAGCQDRSPSAIGNSSCSTRIAAHWENAHPRFVLPNSFKAAHDPMVARIPRRIGCGGRRLLLTDARHLTSVPAAGRSLRGAGCDAREQALVCQCWSPMPSTPPAFAIDRVVVMLCLT